MLFLSLLVLILLTVYVWRRRRIYYIAFKLKGPFAFPFIGTLYKFIGDYTKLYNILREMCFTNSNIFKWWIGPYLHIVDSRPEDVEIILNNCLDKANLYNFGKECFGEGLLIAPLDVWKRHRKLINPSFSIQVLKTFHEAFVNQANHLMIELNEFSAKGKVDLFSKIFKCTMDLICETLCDVDSVNVEGQEKYIENITRYTDSLPERFYNPLFHINLIWKFSNSHKRTSAMINAAFDVVKEILTLKRATLASLDTNDKLKKKIFLNQLVKLKEDNKFTEKEILDEVQLMLVAGSETTAITLSFVILAIGINPDVQENMFKELDSIFGGSTRDPTVDDLNRMDYLERVIKETLRLQPTVPFIFRAIYKDLKLSDGMVLPSGTSILLPIFKIHRDPQIWKNPLKFDPDRFLPEEVKTRHPHSFIPFSYGPRNCIGYKFGMSSMKVILSTFLRNYKIVSVDYKSIDEIEILWAALARPKYGCQVRFEKRKKWSCNSL